MIKEVLAKAGRRFSTHGYHATSIPDLEDCMGIKRSSIYHTFGSKRSLFLSALRSCIGLHGGSLREIVEQESSPVAAIMDVFAAAQDDVDFIIKTAVEVAAHNAEIARIVAAAQRELVCLFSTLIVRGQAVGEIADVDPVQAGRALLESFARRLNPAAAYWFEEAKKLAEATEEEWLLLTGIMQTDGWVRREGKKRDGQTFTAWTKLTE